MESRGLALESQIVKLKKDLEDGKKALEEGATVFHELERQHQQNVINFNAIYNISFIKFYFEF